MFSRQIRDSAENILGFNATSMQARTLLGALGTAPKTATVTAEQKKINAANFESALTGEASEAILKKNAQNDAAERDLLTAETDYAQGAITLEKKSGSYVNKVSTNSLSNTRKLVETAQQAGTTINATAVTGIIEADRLTTLANYRAYIGANDINRTEAVEGIKQINSIYNDTLTYAKSIGEETVTAAKVTLQDNYKNIHGNENFWKQEVMKKAYGEDSMNKIMDLQMKFYDQPEILEERLRHVPNSEAIISFLSGGTELTQAGVVKFNNLTTSSLTKRANGEALTRDEELVYPSAINMTTALPNGNRNSDAVEGHVSTLIGNGDAMTSSMISKVPATRAGKDSITEMKRSYKEDSEAYLRQAGEALATTADPKDISYAYDSEGILRVTLNNRPAGNSTVDDAKDRVNIYAEALNRGWSSNLGITKEEYQNRVIQSLDKYVVQADTSKNLVLLNNVVHMTQTGNTRGAERVYNIFNEKTGNTLPEYSVAKASLLNQGSLFTKMPTTLGNEGSGVRSLPPTTPIAGVPNPTLPDLTTAEAGFPVRDNLTALEQLDVATGFTNEDGSLRMPFQGTPEAATPATVDNTSGVLLYEGSDVHAQRLQDAEFSQAEIQEALRQIGASRAGR